MSSIIDRAAEQAELGIERDVPQSDKRRVRDWARVIGICRKLEVQEGIVREELNHKYLSAVEENRHLMAKVHELSHKLEQLELRDRMREMELPRKDQQFLLDGPEKVAEDAA